MIFSSMGPKIADQPRQRSSAVGWFRSIIRKGAHVKRQWHQWQRSVSASAFYILVVPSAIAAPDLSNVLGVLNGMQGGSWAQLSINKFSDAWPDLADRPFNDGGYSNTGSIIPAWSGFAWDSKRAEVLLFGGGHANYAGNEVYRWSAATRTWERGSLPSDVILVPGTYIAKDGALNAPLSAHTYDNNNYLAVADRFLVLGGAVFNSGGGFRLPDGNGGTVGTGPYFWDPSKADPNKVGGTTGSGVDPTTLGGQMWENRQVPGMADRGFANSTSAAVIEGGRDVVYFTSAGGGSTNQNLYRYVVNDVNNASADTVERVGIWSGGSDPSGAGAYDPESRLYVASGDATRPFQVWDLDNAGLFNSNQTVTPVVNGINGASFEAGAKWGMDWDPVRKEFVLWSGGGDVWTLDAPAAGTIAGQWTLTQITEGDDFLGSALPPPEIQNFVRGKWKYASNLDAFVGLEGAQDGNIWIYKPMGWTNPVPEPSTWAMLGAGLAMLMFSARRLRA